MDRDMTEETQVVPDVEIMVIPDVEFQYNALRFHKRLDDATIDQLFSGLRKFKEGYQFYLQTLGERWKASGMNGQTGYRIQLH